MFSCNLHAIKNIQDSETVKSEHCITLIYFFLCFSQMTWCQITSLKASGASARASCSSSPSWRRPFCQADRRCTDEAVHKRIRPRGLGGFVQATGPFSLDSMFLWEKRWSWDWNRSRGRGPDQNKCTQTLEWTYLSVDSCPESPANFFLGV